MPEPANKFQGQLGASEWVEVKWRELAALSLCGFVGLIAALLGALYFLMIGDLLIRVQLVIHQKHQIVS